MKINVTFKTPDVLEYIETLDLNEEEIRRFKSLTEKYIKYGEMVTLEFDLENNSVRVVEV